jgi:hypothetical protein
MTVLHNKFNHKKAEIPLTEIIDVLKNTIITAKQFKDFLVTTYKNIFESHNNYSPDFAFLLLSEKILDERGDIRIDLLSGNNHDIEDYWNNNGNQLQNFNVRLNFAINAVIEHVKIHYEYFNYCYYEHHNTIGNELPLFFSTDIIKGNQEILCFRFQEQLRNVRTYIYDKIREMDTSFCRSICKHTNCPCKKCKCKCNECKEDGCFFYDKNKSKSDVCLCKQIGNFSMDMDNCKESLETYQASPFCVNKTLYANRIISNVINYIDSFREFLHKDSEFNENLKRTQISNQKDIQESLIKEINHYVNLYVKRPLRMSEYMKNLYKIFKENIDKAKTENEKGGYSKIRYN